MSKRLRTILTVPSRLGSNVFLKVLWVVLPSSPVSILILVLGAGKHPANQCANYNLTDLRPEHRDTLGGTRRTLAADSSSVCHSSQRQK